MRAVIYIERQNIYYYGAGVSSPLKFDFSPELVQDMDIINEELLTKKLDEFIKTNKIKPAEIIISFSQDCVFKKEIPEETSEDEIKEIREDFEINIPFNNTCSKEFKGEKKIVLVGINKDLAEIIKCSFVNNEFTVSLIFPLWALYKEQNVSFSVDVAENIIKHFNTLSSAGFDISIDFYTNSDHEDKDFVQEGKPKNNRLRLMIGVLIFLVLILVLVFMIFRNKRQSAQSTMVPTQALPAPTFTPTPTITPTEAPKIPKDQIKIEILNGSGVAGEADKIKTQLEEADFTDIKTGNAPTQSAASISIVFKPTVHESYKKEIVSEVESLGYEVSVKENQEIDSDIIITTKKNDK